MLKKADNIKNPEAITHEHDLLQSETTKRKQAENELIDYRQLLETTINHIPAAVCIIRGSDLRLQLINPAYQAIAPGKTMVGRTLNEIWPETGQDFSNFCKQVLETGEPYYREDELNLIKREADSVPEKAYFSWSLHRISLPHEAGWGLLNASWETTKRKLLEDELKIYNDILEERVQLRTKELQKQQEHLQKINQELLRSNRELEKFAYVASHDLQEPLRMVTSFTQLLYEKYKDQLDENAKEYIHFAVGGAKRMYELINALLSYSRISRKEVTFSKVDTKKILDSVKGNLNLILKEKNCTLETADLPEIYADRHQMIQLFQNLILNGIKFSKDHPHILISSKTEETHHLFSVQDHGIGIDPRYFDRIFEIFQRLTPGEYEGTGIGLAICKRIVENHNGKIWVESVPGQGSVFKFSIPFSNPINELK
ncbi:MAG: sensor histidine kinase [Methanosarcina sp.]